MSKEFLHMRSSKSQEFWLPVTDYPRAFRSFRRRIAGSGYEIAFTYAIPNRKFSDERVIKSLISISTLNMCFKYS